MLMLATACGDPRPSADAGPTSEADVLCAALGADCGFASAGNGRIVDCGSCEVSGEICGGGGAPNVCGPNACVIQSCAARGAECGEVSDGCGDVLRCGECTAPDACGGNGIENRCGCAPASCEAAGASCGRIPDGCGGTLECGGCPSSETCGGAGVPNRCGEGACVPQTCAALGAECGLVSDGCGDTMDCGICSGLESCGGGGVPNICDVEPCTPITCASAGAECGAIPNGCDGTLECGVCEEPAACGGGGVLNRCGTSCVRRSCLREECGATDDGCGGTMECPCHDPCGDGIWDPSTELCDIAAPTGTEGACPQTCRPSGLCIQASVTNAGTCQAQCIESPITTTSTTPDYCCPSGATSDVDCPQRYPFVKTYRRTSTDSNGHCNDLRGIQRRIYYNDIYVPLAPSTTCRPIVFEVGAFTPFSQSQETGQFWTRFSTPQFDYTHGPNSWKWDMYIFAVEGPQIAGLVEVGPEATFMTATWDTGYACINKFQTTFENTLTLSFDEYRPTQVTTLASTVTDVELAADDWGQFLAIRGVEASHARVEVAATQYVQGQSIRSMRSSSPFRPFTIVSGAGQAGRPSLAIVTTTTTATSYTRPYAYVAWQEDGTSLWISRLDQDGLPGAPFSFSTGTGIGDPTLVVLDDSHLGAAWTELVDGVRRLRLARLDSGGALVGAVVEVSSPLADVQEHRFAAWWVPGMPTAGSAALVWTEARAMGVELYSVMVDETAALVGTPALIDAGAVAPRDLDVRMEAPSFHALWTDERDGYPAIYTARYSGSFSSSVRMSPLGRASHRGRYSHPSGRETVYRPLAVAWIDVASGALAYAVTNALFSSEWTELAPVHLTCGSTVVGDLGVTSIPVRMQRYIGPKHFGAWIEDGRLVWQHLPSDVRTRTPVP